MNYSFRNRKLISLSLSVVMALTVMPGIGSVAFADAKGCDHDNCSGHRHDSALPTGGMFEPEITFGEAPSVEELLLPEGKEAANTEVKRASKKALKSGARSGYESAAEELANTVFDSPDDAVATVRRAMTEGTNSSKGLELTVCIDMSYWNKNDLSAVSDWNDFMNSEEWHKYNSDGLAVLGKAMAYTGNPREGDYLAFRWNTGSYGFGFPQPGYLAPDGSGRPYMQWNATIGFFTTKAQEEEVDEMVEDVLEDLDLEGKSELEKIKAIYGWVTTEVTYDFENLNVYGHTLKYTAYAAIKNRTAVCQGYAALLYRMMNEAGLKCRMVNGIGAGGGHAWNAAKAGSRWYYLDSTWDFQLKDVDGGYDEDQWEYFLRGRNDFGDHHPQVGSNVANNFWPDGVDYRYNEDVWLQKYPIPAGRYYADSNDPDCEHSFNSGTVIQPLGCEQDEKSLMKCTKCSATKIEITAEHPISGHLGMSETETEVEATCTRPGGITMQCYKCGETYFRPIPGQKPALGHSFGSWQPLPSGDPDYLKKHMRVCSRDEAHVEKAVHTWNDGVVTLEPTETQEGVRTFTCTGCGDTRTEPIHYTDNGQDPEDPTDPTDPGGEVPGDHENINNPLKAKAGTVKIRYSKLKKKNQTIKRAKAMTIKDAKGTVTYTKVKVNKKKYAGRFKVNSKTGNITVKKKTKKGTYKVTIRVNAAGNKDYKAGSKTVTVVIKIK